MSLARKISELLTNDEATSERRGIWGALLRLAAPSVVGVKVALAAVALADGLARSGALGETAAQASTTLAAQIGRGASPESAAMALAAIVLLDDGGKRAMSIAQRALRLAIRPLLNERHQTGLVEGRSEGLVEGRSEGRVEGRSEERQEWEAWLERQQEAGTTWRTEDPPPGRRPQE